MRKKVLCFLSNNPEGSTSHCWGINKLASLAENLDRALIQFVPDSEQPISKGGGKMKRKHQSSTETSTERQQFALPTPVTSTKDSGVAEKVSLPPPRI